MKAIYIIILFYTTLFCASVDIKLYEGKDREIYHQEIKKEIEKASSKKLRPQDIIKDELIQLYRIDDAISQNIQIEKYNTEEFNSKSITTKQFYNAIIAISNLQFKQDYNNDILESMLSKLLFIKNSIQNITENEKQKLLSYQLQFAYYKIQQQNIQRKVSLLKDDEKNIKTTLLKSFSILECDNEKSFEDKLSSIEKKISKNTQDKIFLELQKEKALIEESESILTLNKTIDTINIQQQSQINKKIVLSLTNSLCFLKNKDSSSFYKIISDTQDTIEQISDEKEKVLFLNQVVILKELSKSVFGKTKLFFGSTLQESKDILLKAKEFFISPLFVFNEHPISLYSLFKAFIYLVIGFILGMIYKRWIVRLSYRWKDISMMSMRLASNIGYYLIILVFFIISISSLGIDLSSLSLIAGALSIGIGFGLQTVVSNLIAGIILMIERTIRIGDAIEISDVVVGIVTDMRIRSTTVKTFDNIDIVVPNSTFIQNNVVNWTLDDRIRRVHIPFCVAYGTEVDDVKNTILNALEKSELYYIRNNEEKKPAIRMTLMNSSSVDFELVIWVEWDTKLKKISLRSDFLILIYDTLRANNIDIPFPQLDIYFKQMLDETKVLSKT